MGRDEILKKISVVGYCYDRKKEVEGGDKIQNITILEPREGKHYPKKTSAYWLANICPYQTGRMNDQHQLDKKPPISEDSTDDLGLSKLLQNIPGFVNEVRNLITLKLNNEYSVLLNDDKHVLEVQNVLENLKQFFEANIVIGNAQMSIGNGFKEMDLHFTNEGLTTSGKKSQDWTIVNCSGISTEGTLFQKSSYNGIFGDRYLSNRREQKTDFNNRVEEVSYNYPIYPDTGNPSWNKSDQSRYIAPTPFNPEHGKVAKTFTFFVVYSKVYTAEVFVDALTKCNIADVEITYTRVFPSDCRMFLLVPVYKGGYINTQDARNRLRFEVIAPQNAKENEKRKPI